MGYRSKLIFKRKLSRWSLRTHPDIDKGNLYSSAIAHRCSLIIHRIAFTTPPPYGSDRKEVCFRCDKPIPNYLIGLWKMHNFEVYQQDREIQPSNPGWVARPGRMWEYIP